MRSHNLSTFHKSAIALATADPQQSLNSGIIIKIITMRYSRMLWLLKIRI